MQWNDRSCLDGYTLIRLCYAPAGAFHILVIVADGQVTRTAGLAVTQFSKQEKDTMAAIVDARCDLHA